MPSLADIPDNLLDNSKRMDFIFWVAALPIDWPTAKVLLDAWRQHVAQTITDEQYAYVRRAIEAGRGR